jgi:acyl carrier protein
MSIDIAAPMSQETIEPTVKRVVAKALELDASEIEASASLQLDFNAQSLDMLDISFALEREFKVPFPQSDLIQRASAHIDEDLLIQKGKITDVGLELLRTGMPEAEASRIVPGLRATDVVGLITVNTFTRLVIRLLEAKAAFPRECPKCGAETREAESMPEFECPNCGDTRPLPSGDDVLFGDMMGVLKGLGLLRDQEPK